MINVLCIGLGGAIGTILRYLVSSIDYRFSNGVFPLSTMIVNVLGSFTIGLLWGVFERVMIAPAVRMFIFVGILGGFTTFSTYSLESFNLLRDGEYKIALLNIFGSNILAIGGVISGFLLAQTIMTFYRR